MGIRVLIVDDHHIVRRGLVIFLSTQEGIKIVGEAANGEEAVTAMKDLQPDVILMDLFMPVMDGIEATRIIKEHAPSTKILILTSYSDRDHVLSAIHAGADSYQLKEVEPDELVRAIHALYLGEGLFHPKVTKQVMQHLVVDKKASGSKLDLLTAREQEVLQEIACGKSNKDIAVSLMITEKTVKTHVSNLLAKLELDDRLQAALYAVRHGLK